MKKKLNTKPFTVRPLPTHFELILTRKDKEGLKKVLEYLYDMESFKFTWYHDWVDDHAEYTIHIEDGCWADNLEHIASLLSDFDYDGERDAKEKKPK